MKLFAIATLAAGLVSGATALACHSGTKYCGRTVAEGLRGWTYGDVVAQARGGPSGLSVNNVGDILFECEDHWYWETPDLHFKDYCANGCINNGAGHDDACA